MTGPPPARNSARYLVREDIRAMRGYTPGLQRNQAIKLNTNECPFPPSPTIHDLLRDVADDRLRLYPDPASQHLRDVAAARFNVLPQQVLVGNGSDDCLTILYRAICQPGDAIATPWPTYGLYETLATLQGCGLAYVDYRLLDDPDDRHGPRWELPEALANQQAKLVLVANPNNPSGTLTPVLELRRLADRLDAILVVDEAYGDFAVADDDQPTSMLPVLDQHPNVVVLRSFSKSYSLAGARLGLLFAHTDLVEEFQKVKDSYNVNALSQAIGVAALEDRDHWNGNLAKTLRGRDDLEALLQPWVRAKRWRWPRSQANFLLIEVGPDAGAIKAALAERGILVRQWSGPVLGTKLRITVGSPEQHQALVAALREIVPVEDT